VALAAPGFEKFGSHSGTTVVPTGNDGLQVPFYHDELDELFDYTDPAAPTVVAAGVYSATVSFTPSGAEAGKYAEVSFSMDFDSIGGYCLTVYQTLLLSDPGVPFQSKCDTTLSATMQLPAGAKIVAYVYHNCGHDVTFGVAGLLQRVA
jgi:hypothetical protein